MLDPRSPSTIACTSPLEIRTLPRTLMRRTCRLDACSTSVVAR